MLCENLTKPVSFLHKLKEWWTPERPRKAFFQYDDMIPQEWIVMWLFIYLFLFYLIIRWNEITSNFSNHKFDEICARIQQVLEGYIHEH